METNLTRDNLFRKIIYLPQDHGSWVFLITPLVIGLFAGGTFGLASALLVVAAFSAFLIRQPVTIVVKVFSNRRNQRDLPPALLWSSVYGIIGLLAAIGLVALGFSFILLLLVPAVPVFALHLYLVSRRAERRQMGVELVASGVLALAAPAAFWVGVGHPDPIGWWLWLLTWLQSAASIVYAFMRLEQRELKAIPPVNERLKAGWRALLYTSSNLVIVVILALIRLIPPLVFLPFAVQWAESIYGTLRPAAGQRPALIGGRQLVVSILFTLLFILTWK